MLPDDINEFEYIFTYTIPTRNYYYFYHCNKVYGFYKKENGIFNIQQYSFLLCVSYVDFVEECSYDYENYKYQTNDINDYLALNNYIMFNTHQEYMGYMVKKLANIKRQEKIKNLLNG